MPIDPKREKLLSVAEAARLTPNQVHPATLWRWLTKGVKSIRLDSVALAGRVYTTEAALDRFFRATDAARRRGEPAAPNDADLRRRHAAAQKELARLGMVRS